MNTAHREPLFETRFLSDGPQEFGRPILRRLLREAAAILSLTAFLTVFILWMGVGHG